MKKKHAKGMTLVELMIATFIFVLALGALLNSVWAVLYLIDLSRDQTIATTDLRNMMEAIRVTAFADTLSFFPDAVVDGPINNNYASLVGGYSLNNEHITVSYADTHTDPLEMRVNLVWQDKRTRNHNAFVSTFKTR